jgi:hypothetical protein
MADEPSQSGPPRSSASKVVPAIACTLILVQTGAIGWLLQERSTLSAKLDAMANSSSLPATPARANAGPRAANGDIIVPPLPTLQASVAQPPPALPGRGGPVSVPPLPVALPAPLAAALNPPAAAVPTPSSGLPAPTPAPLTDSTTITGSAAVDEIIQQAREARSLGAPEVALESLRQAQKLLPDDPTVQRELAFTLQRMGRSAPAPQESAPPAATGQAIPGLDIGAAPSLPMPQVSKGPIRIGRCELNRDMTHASGLQMNFAVPLHATAGSGIDVASMNVDVFLYEKTAEGQIELRRGEPAQFTFDESVDFSSGTEFLNVTFSGPSDQDLATNGARTFYGYVVKLWYQQQLIDAQASPQTLLQQNP